MLSCAAASTSYQPGSTRKDAAGPQTSLLRQRTAVWRQTALPAASQRQRRCLPCCRATPFDQAWGPALDLDTVWDTLPQNLFALSLFPYLGFLYHLNKSKQAPPLVFGGFAFLLAFVFATIPAGIYAKVAYGKALADVDWLHGSAEFLLTVTNLLIVLGLRGAIRDAEARNSAKAGAEAADDAAKTAANAAQK